MKKNEKLSSETLDVIEFVKKNRDNLKRHYNTVRKSKEEAIDNRIYNELSEKEFQMKLIKTSVVILTANFFECEILNYNIYNDTKQEIIKLKDGLNIFGNNFRVVDAYIFNIFGYTVLHLNAPETGSNTPCGSSDLVRYVSSNKFLKPSCIISFGICYGIDCKKQNLGDTLIAQKIYPWSIGQKITENEWHIKHDDFILDLRENAPFLYKHIENVREKRINRNKDILFEGTVKIGNMNTGEAVVSNAKVRDKAIEEAHGFEIIGGEMEGYGLAKECIYYSKVPCVILKAICDWGASKNIDEIINQKNGTYNIDYKGEIQAYTAYCAYTVLRKLFCEEIFENESQFSVLVNQKLLNYKNEGYIRECTLKKLIKKQLGEKCSDDIVQGIIDTLIADNILSKMCIENIVGYIFG